MVTSQELKQLAQQYQLSQSIQSSQNYTQVDDFQHRFLANDFLPSSQNNIYCINTQDRLRDQRIDQYLTGFLNDNGDDAIDINNPSSSLGIDNEHNNGNSFINDTEVSIIHTSYQQKSFDSGDFTKNLNIEFDTIGFPKIVFEKDKLSEIRSNNFQFGVGDESSLLVTDDKQHPNKTKSFEKRTSKSYNLDLGLNDLSPSPMTQEGLSEADSKTKPKPTSPTGVLDFNFSKNTKTFHSRSSVDLNFPKLNFKRRKL